VKSANTNSPDRPVLRLQRSGNGLEVYKALARVIVRRELIFAGVIPAQDHCDVERVAG
jgi:hypothetical protein